MNYQEIVFKVTEEDFHDTMKRFNISDKMMDESVDQLVNWFEMQPHYPNFNKDDPRLKRTLAENSFSVEKAKKTLENILTARSLLPEYFSDRDMWNDEFKKIVSVIDYIIMPVLTPEKFRVTIVRINSLNSENLDFIAVFKAMSIVEDFRRHYDSTLETIQIFDYNNITLSHVLKTTPTMVKNVDHLTRACFRNKVRGFHVLNLPGYLQTLFTFGTNLMSKKIIDMVRIHKDINNLRDCVPKECLPIEYGGTCGTVQQHKDNLIKCLETEEWRNRILEYTNEKSDESKRPEKSKKNLDFSSLGIEGTFRKLDID